MHHPNTDLILQFYSAFNNKDFKTMQDSYHEQAEFSDPVFPHLSADEVKAMWKMLLTSAKDLKIICSDVWANDQHGESKWEAWYTFTATGRSVHNIVYASFEFKDGKIYRHDDEFNFWRWSRMALGTPGFLLGWTPVIKNKVRKTAAGRLVKFMQQSTQTASTT
jgi:hypothetical protein